MRAIRYYKQNRLQQLRGFCHVVQSGSISRAAEKLFLQQPSVSLQIQALERELDVTLFERRGPRLLLTPEGVLLYEMARPLVEGIDSLHDAFGARRGQMERGGLDIAAGESTILYVLPRFVKAFVEAHPQIDIRLHNVTGKDGLALIRANHVDFAFGAMMEVPEDIIFEPKTEYEAMLIMPQAHPLSPEVHRGRDVTLREISNYPMILPPRGLTTLQLIEETFRRRGLQLRVRLEAGGWEVVKRYVELGLGISIVTSICLSGHENLICRPLSRHFKPRQYGVVIRRGKYLSMQAKSFIAALDELKPAIAN